MWRYLWCLAGLFWACAGTTKPATNGQSGVSSPTYTEEDFDARPALVRSELTTEVDERRYRSAAPPSTRFSAKDPVIYLVGKLKQVPPQAAIEVRWFLDAHPDPILVSEVRGSSTFQFIASYKPTEAKFDRGTHTARVYVNDSEIGAVPFEIFDRAIESKGPRVIGVRFSKNVTQKNRAKGMATQFRAGIEKVFVSFDVKRTDRGAIAEITWSRDGALFHQQDMTLSGNHRYSAHIASPEGLVSGEYDVEIAIGGEPLSKKSFLIGETSSGPTVEQVLLGEELDANQMPKNPTTRFDRKCAMINCGIRFLKFNPNSTLEIQWIQISDTNEIIRFTNRIDLPQGGEGIIGAAWEPPYELESGAYKLVVLVNGEPQAEQPFDVD